MAGRNRLQVPPSHFLAITARLEDQVASQHREIQALLVENQRLAATHLALKEELALAEQQLRRVADRAAEVKAARDAEVREVMKRERAMKLEADVRNADGLKAELNQVRGDIVKLSESREELAEKLRNIDEEVIRVRADAKQVPAVKDDLEAMQSEIRKGRAAIECEKRTHATNFEQRQIMQKNMFSMSGEIDRLHKQLFDSQKKTEAAAASNPNPMYGLNYGNTLMGFRGNSYTGPYATHLGQAIAGNSSYGAETAPQGSYDMQQ